MSSVQQIFLNTVDNPTGPPEEVLGISCVDNDVFIEISKWDETSSSQETSIVAQIQVDLEDLLKSLATAGGFNLQYEFDKD